MKNLKSKLRLSLCLLIVCFSTFAQTDSHDCEIVVTRADLEKCATYKKQNEFLEKEVKLQAVGAVSLKDTIKAKDNSLIDIKKALKEETESKLTWRKTSIILAVIIVLLLCLIIFGHKLAKFIVVFCIFSVQSFAQGPEYRPPFSLNGQKGLNQKIVFDTTANKFSIESTNDAHIFKIPYGKLYINPGNQFQYYRGDKTWQTLNKSTVGLSNVENTAISTWAGSTNITTIGAATASTLRIGASTPYFSLFNYFGSPRLSSTSSIDFFSTGVFSWTTTGDLQQMRLTTTGLKLGTGSAAYKLDLTGDFGYQGLIYVGNTSRGISMSSGSNGQFLKKNTVTDGYGLPLAVNQWASIGISDVSDLSTTLNQKISFVNISITNMSDSSTVTHNLNTTKLNVDFYIGDKPNSQIAWYPDTNNTIKVYLPVRDKPTQKKFTGDVLIAKRQ